jgi:hypothetical protein
MDCNYSQSSLCPFIGFRTQLSPRAVLREVLALGGVFKGDFRSLDFGSLAGPVFRTGCSRQGLAAAAARRHDENRADLGQDFDAVIRLIFVEIVTTGIRPILLQPSSFSRLRRRPPSRRLSCRRRIRLIFIEIDTTGIRPILFQPSSFSSIRRRRPSRRLSGRRRPSSR